MPLPPFKSLEAAYQLHFYLVFKTHSLLPLFETENKQLLIRSVLDEVCGRHAFHLLETNIAEDHLRLLLSLKPEQDVSTTVKLLKGNISRQFGLAFPHELQLQRTKTPFGRGYFARTSGKVSLESVRRYVQSQVSHHGYSGEWTEPLRYQNVAFTSPAFSLSHSLCILDYHLVLVTKFREPIFDEAIAPGLFNCVLAIGRKHGFAVKRMSLLPDHMHLLIQARPDLSMYQCAMAVVNNTRYWMERRFWGVLKQTNVWDVWQPSFYAGTVGEYSTAQVKAFLQADVAARR